MLICIILRCLLPPKVGNTFHYLDNISSICNKTTYRVSVFHFVIDRWCRKTWKNESYFLRFKTFFLTYFVFPQNGKSLLSGLVNHTFNNLFVFEGQNEAQNKGHYKTYLIIYLTWGKEIFFLLGNFPNNNTNVEK